MVFGAVLHIRQGWTAA